MVVAVAAAEADVAVVEEMAEGQAEAAKEEGAGEQRRDAVEEAHR